MVYSAFNFIAIEYCFQIQQYQNFSIPYKGKPYQKPWAVDPSENIADNSGAKAIYWVYERLPKVEKQFIPGFNFTSEQLYG